MSTSTYNTSKEFNEAIYEFVKLGLIFKADGSTLTITFTGGY